MAVRRRGGQGRPFVKAVVVTPDTDMSGYNSGQWVILNGKPARLVQNRETKRFFFVTPPTTKGARTSNAAFLLAVRSLPFSVLPSAENAHKGLQKTIDYVLN